MMRDMTIGQFYNTDSVIHRLDPRVKIMITFIYVISLFFARNPVISAVEIRQSASPIGANKGAITPATMARILSLESETIFR